MDVELADHVELRLPPALLLLQQRPHLRRHAPHQVQDALAGPGGGRGDGGPLVAAWRALVAPGGGALRGLSRVSGEGLVARPGRQCRVIAGELDRRDELGPLGRFLSSARSPAMTPNVGDEYTGWDADALAGSGAAVGRADADSFLSDSPSAACRPVYTALAGWRHSASSRRRGTERGPVRGRFGHQGEAFWFLLAARAATILVHWNPR